jgi:hypothetical protein
MLARQWIADIHAREYGTTSGVELRATRVRRMTGEWSTWDERHGYGEAAPLEEWTDGASGDRPQARG